MRALPPLAITVGLALMAGAALAQSDQSSIYVPNAPAATPAQSAPPSQAVASAPLTPPAPPPGLVQTQTPAQAAAVNAAPLAAPNAVPAAPLSAPSQAPLPVVQAPETPVAPVETPSAPIAPVAPAAPAAPAAPSAPSAPTTPAGPTAPASTTPPAQDVAPAPETAWVNGHSAVIGVLNEVDGSASTLAVPVGGQAKAGDLMVSVQACVMRPQGQLPDVAIYLTLTPQGAGATPSFKGWVVRSQPGASAAGDSTEAFRAVGCS
ncbi:DUF2155 domain-containing protein [Acidocella sp.]|uniref:DUF2155 domain-containing protein n=1 Tax=Acidocella sp. TaxID=50710 RepID=UPI00262BC6C7|nr:DUF2155 domain-containing protein [Acidocella sp.]